MSEYAQDAADALVSIREAGRTGVLERISRDVDPAAGGTILSTKVFGTIDMVVLPVRRGEPLDDSLKEALVQGRLRKLLVAAASVPFVPVGGDVAVFDDSYWIVRGRTELNPDGLTPILYTLIVEDTDLSQADIDALDLAALEAAVAHFSEYVNG